jgi:hypothetical protein
LAKIENNYNALIIEKDNQIKKYEGNIRTLGLDLAQVTEEKMIGEKIISKLKVFLIWRQSQYLNLKRCFKE